jgi:hypothetical protein
MRINAKIDEGADEHVAAEAAEDIEVKCLHVELVPAARTLI